MRNFSLFVLCCAVLLPSAALAGDNNSVEVVMNLVGDHELEGQFYVGDGCIDFLSDCYEGVITMIFEEPLFLITGSLDVTAEVVDPDGMAINDRLPNGTFVPADFPVLIRIEDDDLDGFTFSNAWQLEIQTRNLEFEARSPLRLFRSESDCMPTACSFEDFTRTTGIGSFRAGGSFGTFSEFMIIEDLRPRRLVVIAKINQIQNTIDFYKNLGDISTEAADDLNIKLNAVTLALAQNDFEAAIDAAYDFIFMVFFYDGNGIADGWDPVEGTASVVGILFGQAEALIYAIEERSRPAPISSGGTKQVLNTDGFQMEVTVNFEKATSLQRDSLDLFADEVDPLDPTITDRLPDGVSIDPNFPVIFTIGADPFGRPAARGDWQVQFRTRLLDFLAGSPFRLFKADFGGNYDDITSSLGVGSLLIGAHVGRFDEFNYSEYLVVRDTRPVGDVIASKLTDLQTMLTNFNLDPTVRAALNADLMAASASIMAEDFGQAIADLDAFLDTIDANAGEDLNDIWRSDDNRLNHAGLMAAKVKTLQFSLALAKAPLDADPADVNRDGKVDAADVFALIERVYCPTGCPQNAVPAGIPSGAASSIGLSPKAAAAEESADPIQ